MSDDVAIKVDHVYKNFVLPHERVNSVKSLFTSLTRRHNRSSETQHALKNVNFDIKQGEFFGIVGRNGSGKSTLLKILAGIYQPTKGHVTTKGKLVPFIELGVGFNPELTGRENVYLNGALLGFSRKEIEQMYDDIVMFAELEKFMDQKLKNYSSGMQVRLAFSMATRSEADILLVDEVLAVGDADFQRKCFEYFKSLKKNNKTVVFVSHDMDAIREYCDRALLINDSKMSLIGDTKDVAREYSKLFTGEKLSPETSENTKRWGNQKATTNKLGTDVSGSRIIVSQEIKFHQDLEGAIIGFRLRDASGKEITGTNTKIEGQGLAFMKQGQRLHLVWSLANVLSDGRYSVDSAIVEADGVTISEWWDDAAQFEVKKSRHLPYPVDPPFSLEIDVAK